MVPQSQLVQGYRPGRASDGLLQMIIEPQLFQVCRAGQTSNGLVERCPSVSCSRDIGRITPAMVRSDLFSQVSCSSDLGHDSVEELVEGDPKLRYFEECRPDDSGDGLVKLAIELQYL